MFPGAPNCGLLGNCVIVCPVSICCTQNKEFIRLIVSCRSGLLWNKAVYVTKVSLQVVILKILLINDQLQDIICITDLDSHSEDCSFIVVEM